MKSFWNTLRDLIIYLACFCAGLCINLSVKLTQRSNVKSTAVVNTNIGITKAHYFEFDSCEYIAFETSEDASVPYSIVHHPRCKYCAKHSKIPKK